MIRGLGRVDPIYTRRFTHGYNLLWKLLSFAASLFLIAGLSAFFSPYLDRVVLVRAPQVVMNWTPVVLFLWAGFWSTCCCCC